MERQQARAAARSQAAMPPGAGKLRPMPGRPPKPLVVNQIAPAPSRRGPQLRGRPAPVVPFPGRKQPLPAPVSVRRRFQAERGELELAEMARRHLAYEIKMVRETANALRGNGIGPRSFRNAMLETFLIHYRNLLDFFYADKKRSLAHDVRAADYVIDAKRWRDRRPHMDKEATSNRERVNALLAHLTYRRLRYEERNWSDRRMLRQIEELLAAFAEQLPPRRRRWFQRALEGSAGLSPGPSRRR
jgi:hypothetical protein